MALGDRLHNAKAEAKTAGDVARFGQPDEGFCCAGQFLRRDAGTLVRDDISMPSGRS